jgi:hypothetical protein
MGALFCWHSSIDDQRDDLDQLRTILGIVQVEPRVGDRVNQYFGSRLDER